MNDRRTYYVSVQSGSILEDDRTDAFEFEIKANVRELDKLQKLFEIREDAEHATFRRSFVPGVPYHQDEENDDYDAGMREVYRMIHQLGTKKSRKQIETMGVL